MIEVEEISNFCTIPLNKLYDDILNILEQEKLSMNNPNDYDKIVYEIEKIQKKSNFSISNKYNKSKILEQIVYKLKENDSYFNTDNVMQGNSMLLFADDDYMYDLLYLDNIADMSAKKIPIEYLNEFATISNYNLEPIYYDSCILKSDYRDGTIKMSLMSDKDITNLILSNYYHKGVMISTDGKMDELRYTGDNPRFIIGNDFNEYKKTTILNLTVLLYKDSSNEINELSSKLIEEEIRGRVFIMFLCPERNSKFWDITTVTIENILKIMDNKEKKINLLRDSEDIDPTSSKQENKNINPFFYIKKYCI